MRTALSIDVGRKNLALCLMRPGADPRGADDTILRWTVTTCDPSAKGIRDALDLLPWAAECDDVVIERQPPRNATMSRLQHYLEMYFAMRDKPVTVQDAKHKLAFAAGTPWWPAGDLDSWTYHTRKKVSVQTTDAFLSATQQDPDLVAAFRASKKKDDFADSCLQCMAFCHHLRPLELAKRATGQAPVKPRRPTDKQLASGRLSKSGIAWTLRQAKAEMTEAGVVAAAAGNKALQRSIDREFGGPAGAARALGA